MADAFVFEEDSWGFYLQQATEKALKAWLLLLLPEQPPFTHNLRLLFQMLGDLGADIEPFKALSRFTLFIERRERQRVEILLSQIDPRQKTLVFCATQEHAVAIRDLINQLKSSSDPHYCQRVTADDGEPGNRHLRAFQDNEKTIPTILTTSQKLSTGVDARNVRNIVLLRPINSMIEFQQIIGRGTRLYDGKDYFTILDFVKAHHHFSDPEWDGEPIAPEGPEQRIPRQRSEQDDADHGSDPAEDGAD